MFKTFLEIAQAIVQRIFGQGKKLTDLNPGSVIRTLIEAFSDSLEKFYEALKWTLDQAFVLTAEGEYLDKKVAERGITRKPATYATAKVVLGRLTPAQTDTLIPAGSLVATGPAGDKPPVYFRTLSDAVIPAGQLTVEVVVQCTEPGLIGNVGVGQINLPASPGFDTVYNPEPATGGTDGETDEELRQRYLAAVRTPIRGGTRFDYEFWAMTVPGVLSARCLPLNRGPGTVDVLVTTAGGIPSPELLDQVQDVLDRERPLCVDARAIAPEAVTVDVSIYLQPADGYTIEGLAPAVREAVIAYIQQVAVGDVVRLTGIGNAVHDVPGVLDYSIITPATNIVLEPTQMAVPGTITVG